MKLKDYYKKVLVYGTYINGLKNENVVLSCVNGNVQLGAFVIKKIKDVEDKLK